MSYNVLKSLFVAVQLILGLDAASLVPRPPFSVFIVVVFLSPQIKTEKAVWEPDYG